MAFSHSDGRSVATPENGPAKAKAFGFNHGVKASFDPGHKRAYGKGYRVRPLYIATGSAEPKLSFDFSSAREVARFRKHVGQGKRPIRGQKVTFSHVFTRDGITEAWTFKGCELSGGGGWDSDDNGVQSKMEFMLLDALLDGVSIYEEQAQP